MFPPTIDPLDENVLLKILCSSLVGLLSLYALFSLIILEEGIAGHQ